MNHEERSNAIGLLLRETILNRYERPSRFDDATARTELAAMVDDLNSNWPLCNREGFASIAERFATTVRQTIGGRDWPSIPNLIKALKEANKSAALPVSGGIALCEYEIAASRIKAGEPVAQAYIYGSKAKEIVRRGLVTNDELGPYRSGAFVAQARLYGDERAREWQAVTRAAHTAAPYPTTEADLIEARKRRAEG